MSKISGISITNALTWQEDQAFDSSAVPSMLGRKISRLSKAALSIAMAVCKNETIDFSVFCSQHGEISRAKKLLIDLANKETLSPTAFSFSVHNATSGVFSMISNNTKPTTALAAGNESLSYGLVEAWAFLKDNPESSVLLTYYDDKVPEIFGSFTHKTTSHSLALILRADSTQNNAIKITGKMVGQVDSKPSYEVPSLQLSKFIHSNENRIVIRTQQFEWVLMR